MRSNDDLITSNLSKGLSLASTLTQILYFIDIETYGYFLGCYTVEQQTLACGK